jgi:hypothetical protein
MRGCFSGCRGKAGRPAHQRRQLSEGSRAMNKQGKMNQWLWDMFSAGLPMDYDLEALRKIFLINLIAFVGGLVLFAFSILEFIIQDYYLFFMDMLFFFVLAGLFIYLRKTKNYHVVSLIGTTLTGFFYIFFHCLRRLWQYGLFMGLHLSAHRHLSARHQKGVCLFPAVSFYGMRCFCACITNPIFYIL